MSSVRLAFGGYRHNLKVTASVVTTGWMPGQVVGLNTTFNEYAVMIAATGTRTVGILMDDDNELATPPSGKRVTVIAGNGILYISHAEEVAAGSATRAYETGVASATPGTRIGYSTNGKLAVFPTETGGDVIGTLIQVPAAANNFEVGLQFRI